MFSHSFVLVANVFSKSLRRKTSLTHLAQAARTVLHSTEPVTQMIADWQEIDFKEIVKQTLWTFSSDPATDCQVIEKCKYPFYTQTAILLFLVC